MLRTARRSIVLVALIGAIGWLAYSMVRALVLHEANSAVFYTSLGLIAIVWVVLVRTLVKLTRRWRVETVARGRR